ncbi:hypothetical protein IOD16_37945 [Saccharothrix sp. 6-C]|uniref:hypothetical protein n=1 Tax=Saccharothrix sp. 6-C TaxID=2781735 RepID=UPI001917295D|nr:hypothetical protein [Saccharothrix sp. 6-C]QQQ76692.1 hypothetical protein IOD16_37945 [Saccharothrix sp. 6-C]
MTTSTAPKSWVPVVAWTQVTLGSVGLVGVLASPAAAVVVGAVAAPTVLACRALVRASRKLDRIMAEELDPPDRPTP